LPRLAAQPAPAVEPDAGLFSASAGEQHPLWRRQPVLLGGISTLCALAPARRLLVQRKRQSQTRTPSAWFPRACICTATPSFARRRRPSKFRRLLLSPRRRSLARRDRRLGEFCNGTILSSLVAVRAAVRAHSPFVAARGAIAPLLLGELAGPKQNFRVWSSGPATRLGFRDSVVRQTTPETSGSSRPLAASTQATDARIWRIAATVRVDGRGGVGGGRRRRAAVATVTGLRRRTDVRVVLLAQ
jgi:hypothetical protein